MNIRTFLEQRVRNAMSACGLAGNPGLQPAARPEFGDYQVNGIMGVAKQARRNPRELAGEVIAALDLDGIAEPPELAGPGFINLRLTPAFLAEHLATPLAVTPAGNPQHVVVDYSAPNLAKEMHVGHLRSTIIGDAVVRVLSTLGHTVTRQNHVGDWGTQFGMLLTHMQEAGASSAELADLEAFYVQAKQRFDSDAEFAMRSRANVVALQSGEVRARAAWQRFIDISLSHCQAVYDRLGVLLTAADVQPESAYNDDLPEVIRDLATAGLLTQSDGAQCVFLDEFKGKDGNVLPLIVQKSDGGYLYATTDLAAIRYRARTLRADRVLYFTDARQALHFRQVFAVARAAGFAPPDLQLEHLPFGAMLGRDGKPFKTRAGGVVKLTELLDEATQRARAIVNAKSAELPEEERARIAHAVGIGAVKYADLSKNRTNDYLFDWDQMLSFDGNTAPYLQYACTRIRSIFRRVDADFPAVDMAPAHAAERQLAMQLLRYQEVVETVAAEGLPHFLCVYLYDLATRFSQFYEQCPVLNAEADDRARRLGLCARTLATLEGGLGLLGIEVPERM
ncbi:MAG: arginine--tRNA ligase [Pseudomonadales bacterium]|nr:arginine--tRNA ligase [Pseudomonadales bacterium]MCP5182427.1 arginine--tRNA ligase [Pseudomonadales bacterium]